VRYTLIAMLLLGGAVRADVAIYEDGVKVLTCTPVQATTEPPAPSPEPTPPPPAQNIGTVLYGRTGNNEAQPVNGQPLYAQTLLAPGEVFFEYVADGSIHHMEWFDNGVKIRRENYWPYTTRYSLAAGNHTILAVIYSSETDVLGTYSVDIYVGDGGASADPAAQEPKFATVEFEWTTPTTREDGEPLSPGEIARYYLKVTAASYEIPGELTSYAVQLSPGDYTVTVTAEDTGGIQSLPSDSVAFRL